MTHHDGKRRTARPAIGGSLLLGMDAGFSRTRATTGLAWGGAVPCGGAKAGTAWEQRQRVLPPGLRFDLIAIDAPLLPPAAPDKAARLCEAAFLRAPFHDRCKPGLSHFGAGLDLRRAGAEAARQLRAVAAPDAPMIEAFPHLFMAVLLPEDLFAAPPPCRARKSDHFYELCLEQGCFAAVMARLDWRDEGVTAALARETDHDRRAALVCLLTAACAAAGQCVRVGDAAGGWLWLPPWPLWQGWARDGLRRALDRLPGLEAANITG